MRIRCSIMVCMFAMTAASCSTQAEPKPDADDFELWPTPEPDVKVIGGAPTTPAIWPATFLFDNRCTATAIGPRVILTAAHCVGSSGTGVIQTSVPMTVTCTPHDKFTGVNPYSYDVALCLTPRSLPVVKYESVNRDASKIARDRGISILGFGCLQEGGPMATSLYLGSAKVVADPTNPDPPSIYTLKGGAVACNGDSGGGAYSQDGTRVLTGVQSSTKFSDRQSRQISMTDPEVRRFFSTWSAPPRNAEICGYQLAPGTQNCR